MINIGADFPSLASGIREVLGIPLKLPSESFLKTRVFLKVFPSCVCRNCVCCRACNPELCGLDASGRFWSCALLQLQQNVGWFRWEYFLWEFRSWDCVYCPQMIFCWGFSSGVILCAGGSGCRRLIIMGIGETAAASDFLLRFSLDSWASYLGCEFSLEGIASLPVFARPSGGSVLVNNLRSTFSLSLSLPQQQQTKWWPDSFFRTLSGLREICLGLSLSFWG